MKAWASSAFMMASWGEKVREVVVWSFREECCAFGDISGEPFKSFNINRRVVGAKLPKVP